MSSENSSTLDKVRSITQKFSRELEAEDVHVHGAVVQALNNFLQFRAVQLQVAEQESEALVKAEVERQAKFGLTPGGAHV